MLQSVILIGAAVVVLMWTPSALMASVVVPAVVVHCRHAAVNDIEVGHLEPSGLYRSDGRRPDGASIVPWKEGRILVWDATCPDPLAPSYLSIATTDAGAVARETEHRK